MSQLKPNITASSLRVALAFTLALFALLTAASSASAAPELKVSTIRPDHVSPGKVLSMLLTYQNVGDEPLDGELTLTTVFPTGIVPAGWLYDNIDPLACSTSGQEGECTRDVTGLLPGEKRYFTLRAQVEPSVSGTLTGGQVELSGGGSADVFTESFDFAVGPVYPFAIRTFDVTLDDGPGLPATQAGATPTAVNTVFNLSAETTSTFGVEDNANFQLISPPEHLRDAITHVPAGFVGNPLATVRCPQARLVEQTSLPSGLKVSVPNCPDGSQIGLAQVDYNSIVGVFNLIPPPGYPAAFGFFYESVIVTLLAKVRPADNGIDIVTEKTVSSVPLPRTEVALWGVPSDPSHDSLRGVCIKGGYGFNPSVSAEVGGCDLDERNGASFLRTPTSCPGTPLPWSIKMNTYQNVGRFVSKATTSPAMEGCEQLPFEPDISLAPETRSTHSPSGLEVDLSLPQGVGPDGLAPADLRAARVELPQGIGVNPASADGLGACSDSELRLGLEGPSNCPEASKLGSLELTTPLLEEPVDGSVFLRSQASSDPESGDLYRLALELRSDKRGIAIKLPGSLVADAETGQLTASFKELPQLPFESMQLHLKSGPRAPLTTPSTCGTYTTHAEFTAWSGKVVPVDSSFAVDRNCAAPPFAPGFQAGVSDATAGGFSPFSLRVTRSDGEPNIARLDVTLPEGELAKLAGVGVCPEAGAAIGDCPASSRLGTTTVGAGVGSNPLYLPQPGKAPTAVYFAGPYKGAPYSLVVAVPAQAGPFDLGTVAVRSRIEIDPDNAQVSVLSDPLPQIVGGVPVAYRDIRVNVDRPDYTLNPTSCEPQAVRGSIVPTVGGSASVSDRFQASDCGRLKFKPRLALRLKGGTERSDHPALRATLTMPKWCGRTDRKGKCGPGANIARAVVSLPHSAFLAQDHIRTICTRVQFAAGGGGGEKCPAGSIYGRARAFSPLLDYPLEGPVYLRSSSNPLPDLVVALDGQIHVDLVGRIDSKNGGIRTTFSGVPDAPVSKFVLSMQGGRKGLLENSTNICRSTNRASVKFDAQNGKFRDFRAPLKADCGRTKDRPRKGKGAQGGAGYRAGW